MTEDNAREAVPERWNAVGPGSDMWMDVAQDPRFATDASLQGERATLLDFLRGYRLTMELKCADLDAAQLARRSVPPSVFPLTRNTETISAMKLSFVSQHFGEARAFC